VINTPADNRKPWVGIPAPAMARGLKKDQLKHTFPLPNNAFSIKIPAQLTDVQKYLHYETENVHYRQVSEWTSTKQVIFYKRTLSLKHCGQYSMGDVCNHETRPRSIFSRAAEIQQSQG